MKILAALIFALFSITAFAQTTLQFGNFKVLGNISSTQDIINGYATTATAAGTTTLTVLSAGQQYFTGSTTQTVALPVVSTLVLGQQYTIVNNSSGAVTVQSSGGNTLQAMAANTQLVATVISTSGTGTSSWSWQYGPEVFGTVLSVGMTVPAFLSVSGSPVTSSGTLAVSYSGTALPVANGGTGLTSIAAHDVLIGAGASTITPVAPSAIANALVSNGTGSDPSFQTLSVAGGGTGITFGTSGGILGFTASGTIASSAALTANQLVIGGGAGTTPSALAAGSQFQVLTMGASNPGYGAVNLAQSAAVTGALPIANGGTGQTSANAAFNALSPMTTLGDIEYEDNTPKAVRLAGNTAGTKKFLSQTGTGSVSAAPSWGQPACADLSNAATSCSTDATNAGNISAGTLAVARGGTGQTSYTDGQLLIGNSSGNTLTKATLTAGANITITNGNGSISVAASSSAAAAWNYTAQTTNYSASINDYVLASGASFTITLPTAASQSGKSIMIQHNGTSFTQLYTLNTTSAQTINGPGGTVSSGNYVLYTNGEVLLLMSDGSNWQIVSHKTDTGWVDGGAITVTGTTSNPTKGTASVDHFWWKRVGSTMEARIEYKQTATGGAAGSGDYLFLIPSSQTINTSFVTAFSTVSASNVTSTGGVGFAQAVSSGSSTGSGAVDVYDTTHVRLIVYNGASIGGVGSSFFALNTAISYNAAFTIPISNWQP